MDKTKFSFNPCGTFERRPGGGATRAVALGVLLACATASLPAAEPLRGATAILKSVADSSNEAGAATKPLTDAAKLRVDLTNFAARAVALAPEAAARRRG